MAASRSNKSQHDRRVSFGTLPLSPREMRHPEDDDDDLTPLLHASPAATESINITQGDEETNFDDLPPLAANNEPKSFLQILKNFVTDTGLNTYHGLIWIKSHPLAFLTALITAAPNALFAFTSKPENLRELLKSMGPGEIAFASTKSAAALIVNAIMNAYFLTTAWGKIKPILSNLFEKVKHMPDSPRAFMAGLLELFLAFIIFSLALSAAIGAGALSFASFAWTMMYVAALPALISLVVNFASRFVGVKNIFIKLNHLGSNEVKTQRALADAVNHINLSTPNHERRLQWGFDRIKARVKQNQLRNHPDDYELKDRDLEPIYIELAKMISTYHTSHEDFLLDTTNKEILLNYLLSTVEVLTVGTSLVILALPYSLSFLQKGYDGVNIIVRLLEHAFGLSEDGLTNLPGAGKIGVGVPTLIATFLLCASTLIDGRLGLKRLLHHLYENPQDLLTVGVLGIANGLAAFSPRGVGESVVNNPNNLMHLKHDRLGSTYITANMLMGGFINFMYSTGKVVPSNFTLKDLTLEAVRNRLEDPTNHCISKDTAYAIQRIAFFKPADNRTEQERQADMLTVQSAPGF